MHHTIVANIFHTTMSSKIMQLSQLLSNIFEITKQKHGHDKKTVIYYYFQKYLYHEYF